MKQAFVRVNACCATKTSWGLFTQFVTGTKLRGVGSRVRECRALGFFGMSLECLLEFSHRLYASYGLYMVLRSLCYFDTLGEPGGSLLWSLYGSLT